MNAEKTGLLIVALWLLSACARAPIPTATLPSATPLPSFTPTIPNTHTPIPTAAATETILATAAATLAPTSTPTAVLTPIAYERNSRAVLIEADSVGGFTPVPREAHVPTFRLYADGFVVFAGERAPLSTGLDAVVRMGHWSDSEIQNLLAYLNQSGFFALNSFYQPRPVPADLPTARISVYLNKAKTVRVYAPGFQGTPQVFSDAFKRVAQTLPSDAQTFVPADGYLRATYAGSVNDFGASASLADWSNPGVRLADAAEGVPVPGSLYSSIAALVGRNFPNSLYREGDRVYRVRFAPNLPRAAHLTDWVGIILASVREFEGRVFDIVGYYRGANLLGEAHDNPPMSRSAWVVADESGAMYVTGAAPQGLNPSSRADAWTVVRLRAKVVYVRLGTSYLEASSVSILP